MSRSQVPPALQQQIRKYQELEIQLRDLNAMIVQFEQQIREIDRSLKEIDKLPADASVYKSIGAILVKSDIQGVKKDLIETKETTELRLKTFHRQRENARAQLESLRDKLTQQLQSVGPAEGTGGSGVGG